MYVCEASCVFASQGPWNKTSFKPMWNDDVDDVGRELYDHAPGDYGDDFDCSTLTSNDWNSTEIHVRFLLHVNNF